MSAISAPLGYREAVLIGSGATSRVFRAIEGKTGRVVALKRLHRQLVKSAEALARLKRELEALSALRHPSIVPVYDIVRWDGDPTLVMQFIEGQDLKERIVEQGPLAVDVAERVTRSLFDALATAHGAGIVHRDIKPQNVRLDANGNVYLLDFGSARLDASSALTKTGSTVGTPEYMPPELFGGPVYDPRTDIYGVGATIYEALTGRPPQSADSLAELAFMRAEKPIPSVTSVRSDAPVALAQVVDRCLSIRPEERYATASLAVWALDHPTEERIFADRRARRPLCLHCNARVPPKCRTCPSCKRRPFHWAVGHFHVVIDSVEDPSRLIEYIAAVSPEHCAPQEVGALTAHISALSFEKPRFVSFVSEEDAHRIAKDLERAGAQAHVEEDVTKAHQAIPIALAASLGISILTATTVMGPYMFSVAVLVLFGALGERLSSLLKARSGILAPSEVPKSLSTVLESRSAFLTFLLLGGYFVGAANLFDQLTFTGGYLLAMLSAAFGSVVSYWVGIPSSVRRTPAPTRSERVFAALSAVFKRPRKQETALVVRSRPSVVTQIGFVVLLLAIVPYELGTLSALWERISGLPVYASATWSRQAMKTRIAQRTATAAKQGATGAATAVAQTTIGGIAAATPIAAGATAPLLMAGLVARAARRRRKVLKDATTIARELDTGMLLRLSSRTRPQPYAQLPSRIERLEQLEANDAFVREALVRATDLAHHLSPEAVDSMSRMLESLQEGRGDVDRNALAEAALREASLVSRCILETDPEHELRFKLLALEGELEAKAATDWAEKLGRG